MTRGGSDDIGDVSWNVPTVTLRYPSNIPDLPGHHWSNAITMATPIAHKGVTAGAKVLALTMVDLLTKPALVQQAGDYFRDVQTKETKYQPLISARDEPALWLNKACRRRRPTIRPRWPIRSARRPGAKSNSRRSSSSATKRCWRSPRKSRRPMPANSRPGPSIAVASCGRMPARTIKPRPTSRLR